MTPVSGANAASVGSDSEPDQMEELIPWDESILASDPGTEELVAAGGAPSKKIPALADIVKAANENAARNNLQKAAN